MTDTQLTAALRALARAVKRAAAHAKRPKRSRKKLPIVRATPRQRAAFERSYGI